MTMESILLHGILYLWIFFIALSQKSTRKNVQINAKRLQKNAHDCIHLFIIQVENIKWFSDAFSISLSHVGHSRCSMALHCIALRYVLHFSDEPVFVRLCYVSVVPLLMKIFFSLSVHY